MIPTSFGLQLGIFDGRYDLKSQSETVLNAAVQAGYDSVESGLDNIADPDVFRNLLDARNLEFAGLHVTMMGLQDLPALIQTLRILGCADVCNSGLLTWNNPQATDFLESAALLNDVGRRLRDSGIYLHYHNHDFEFARLDGDCSGMELLLDTLDPGAIDLCVDVAWVQKGGQDPAKFLKDHGDRVGYLHFKDFQGEQWTALGRGEVNLPAVLNLMPVLPHLRRVVIEQDSTSGDPEEDITASRRYLRDVLGV